MKYLEDSRLTQLTSDLTGAFLNTRGSGVGSIRSRNRNNNHANRGMKRKNKESKHQHQGHKQSTTQATHSAAHATASFIYNSYNPVGYSISSNYSYSTSLPSSSSCRVIYGRVEAYTTKRAGSDKKTAHEVGERYAHEMERLNEAVEELKRRYLMEKRESG